jgi:hypothetical protein
MRGETPCETPAGVSVRGGGGTDDRASEGRTDVIWLLVLVLLILAIGGGIALSKFLFLLLVVALVLALLGAFNRSPV